MATNGNMVASVVLTLQDRLSAGLGRLRGALDSIKASAERIGLAGALGAGLAIGLPIQQFAAFDQQLRNIAITYGLSGAEAEQYIAKIRKQFQKLAIETAQTSQAVAEGASLMVARGLPSELIDKLLPLAANVATASGAKLSEVAGVIQDINAQLGVAPEHLERAMAMLIAGAKAGKVELRDMAREFPALIAAAANFGFKGLEGVKVLSAMTQQAAKAAGSPAEAANNLRNLLSNLSSPETIKRFKEMGVNFAGLMKDADSKDIPRIEAALQKIRKLTAGDPIKLGELVGDMQARQALFPFLKDLEGYLEIKKKVANAEPVDIYRDLATNLAGPAALLAIITERLTQFTDRLGRELSPKLAKVNAGLEWLGEMLEYVDDAMPGVVGEILSWATTGLVLAGVLGIIASALPLVAVGAKVLLLPLKLLVVATMALKAALIATPLAVMAVVAVLALIAAAVWTIYAHWDDFRPYFQKMWQAVQGYFWGFVLFLEGLFTLDMAKAVEGFKAIWGSLKSFYSTLWEAVQALFNIWGVNIGGWIDTAVTALVARFKAAWAGLTAWFSDLIDRWLAPFDRFYRRVQEVLELLRSRRDALTPLGEPMNWAPSPGGGPAGGGRVTGEIVIRAMPGTAVEEVRSTGPVTVTQIDRGSMWGFA